VEPPRLDRTLYVMGDLSDHVGFLNCERIAERSHIHSWTVEPHYHDGLAQLFVFGAGRIEGRIDTDARRIDGPAMVWMPALISHGFRYQAGMQGWVVTLASADVARLAAQMEMIAPWIDRPQVVAAEQSRMFQQEAQDLVQKAARELHQPAAGQSAALESLFRLLLVNLHRALQAERADSLTQVDRRQALVTRFRTALDQHLDSTRSVADFADMLAVTPTHLSRTLKALTGRTAGELIAERLLLEAKRKLVFTDASVGEIGYALRFSSASYFTRFFTKLTGETPRAFRETMRRRPPGRGE